MIVAVLPDGETMQSDSISADGIQNDIVLQTDGSETTPQNSTQVHDTS